MRPIAVGFADPLVGVGTVFDVCAMTGAVKPRSKHGLGPSGILGDIFSSACPTADVRQGDAIEGIAALRINVVEIFSAVHIFAMLLRYLV